MPHFQGERCPKCGGAPTGFCFADGIDQATGRRIGWTEAVCDCDRPARPFADQAERMRRKRVEAELSLRTVADRLGVTASSMSGWERGESWPPEAMERRWLAAIEAENP